MFDSVSSAILLCGLVSPLGDKIAARPQTAELSIRLLFVTPGMNVDKTMSVLRLQGQEWYGGGGLDSWCRIYDIEPRHTLIVSFRFDQKRGESVLVKTEVLSVSPLPLPAKNADYAKIKVRGKLVRDGKQWFVHVKQSLGEPLEWSLDLSTPNMEQAAKQLVGKPVVLSGEMIRPFHIPGIGGESFLAPSPQPRIAVRTLRPGKKLK